ncbi:glycoside hydrolase family 78 protein [Trichoderma atroviride IMI 206040]|uniref:Glycoside hydrolase family 78 protein n=1 Tax=Hypocrea atroviridis (strain ATCC 20476 / IMI 206040) TaxID=452589 RepID=G9NRU5_HYPAI|nr:glycoside hydrolase family 78 protein [Trichoderma atroviride IMI 206040]EHK46727.1 glycoside hydrolase family 78 protein [Trichoderma atroviride IMI 206040]
MVSNSLIALYTGLVLSNGVQFGAADTAPSWQKYVRSPASNTVKPVAVVSDSTVGNVSNPNGLVDGQEPTVLSRNTESDQLPTIVVDFGQNVVGVLSLQFSGSQSLSTGLPGLRLAFSETTEYLTDRSDFTRSDNASGNEKLTNGTDQVAVKNSNYTWSDLHGCENGTQVCSDGLHGFRYVKIWLEALASDAPYTSSLGSVSISGVSLEWSAYLGTPDTFTGSFECSDESLTQWWYDGVYTVDMGTDVFLANETEPRSASSPTLEGKQVLFDGAKRDRDPYVGDLAVSSLTSYLSHDFAEPSRNVLEDLAQHQRSDGWIPPASIVDLVMYTGNTSYANTYWNTLKNALDGYYAANTDSATGLLYKNDTGYGDYAFLPRSGPVTYYNALYVHALSYASQLATSLGLDDDAERWSSRASSVGKALLSHNFDQSVGAFYDGGPCPGAAAGTYCNVHSQDGNSIAILAGVTNDTTSAQILDYWQNATSQGYGNAFYDSSILSPGDQFNSRVYAFISYFEIAARFATPGQASSAFDELRRLYGWMASHDPQITMWEGIGPGGAPYEGAFTSMAHGWSTGVVPLLTGYVLGVKPQSPGFKTWSICPVVDGGGLTWAKGQVPTPQGKIEVSWEREDAQTGVVFTLNIETLDGSSGVVCVPTLGLDNPTISMDGAPVNVSPDPTTGWASVDAAGGKHVFTVEA